MALISVQEWRCLRFLRSSSPSNKLNRCDSGGGLIQSVTKAVPRGKTKEINGETFKIHGKTCGKAMKDHENTLFS